MMISPQGYMEQHKDKPLEELVKERNKLIEKLNEYEAENILNIKQQKNIGIIIDPSPEVRYSCYNEYLNAITDLIIERQNERTDKTPIDNKKKTDDITAGVLGFVIGDCLGVPVEFKNRYWLKSNPVKDMLEKGSHFQPKGTWSDDTSMVLATMHSLIKLRGYSNNSFYDMADKFVKWYKEGLYTPNGEAFDIGNTTRTALDKFIVNRNKECGEGSLYDNGNGSLMRILPLAYYFYKTNIELEQRKSITFEVSSITHSHIMSKYACLMYVEYLLNILKGTDKYEAYKLMVKAIGELLKSEEKQNKKIISEAYKRILNGKIDKLKEDDIKSSGYVVDTLESVLWIVLNSKEYKESVLEAVNLGDDTDTVGALAGGLLGAIYGYDSIPVEWINLVIRKNEILEICRSWETTKFNTSEDYITIGGEILVENDASKYTLLYEALKKYRDYHKGLNLTDKKKVEEYAFQIVKELFEIKILCRNYDEITRVTVCELKESNDKKTDINKLNVLECLSLITVIQRESYWDGGYTEVFYEYTENEILPLLINRILDIIELTFKITLVLVVLFYYTLVEKGQEAKLNDSLKILKTDEIRNPKFLFKEGIEAKNYYNDFQKLTDDEYEIVKVRTVEVLSNYIKKQDHKDLDIVYNDDSLLDLAFEITTGDNKPKLNREELLNKLREHKATNRNEDRINSYILSGLDLIENELNKNSSANDEYALSVRQKFVLDEFDRYVNENKYELAYYDIEDFIEGAEYTADRYETPKFEYSKYISLKEAKILMSMINKLKKELDTKSTSSDKEMELKIRHTNWSMIGPNDWTGTEWKIYNDLTVDIEKTYNRAENKVEKVKAKLKLEQYNELLKNIAQAKLEDTKIEAFDGDAWEIVQYNNGSEIWKRELGYIYGVKSLENVAQILGNILNGGNKMSFLDKFRKKGKYNTKPENNVPRFVYGVPDVTKYDVEPNDNIPREVYGIPSPSKYDVNPKDNIPEKVYGIKVVDRNADVKRCTKCGCVLKTYIYGKVKGDIDTSKYILGDCIVDEKNPTYHCPNCNTDFDKDIKPIASMLETAIVECVGQDPFFAELIKKYFAEDVKYDDNTAAELLKGVAKDKEIFNEFTKYLVKKNYDIDNAIKVDGISAKDLAEKNPKKTAIEVYAMMSKFKNK